MKIEPLGLPGVSLITLPTHADARGEFVELLPIEGKELHLSSNNFTQVNLSRSRPKVIRGLHYQLEPPQGKLVSCVEGAIFDVVADVRRESATFAQHVVVRLEASHCQVLWVPGGYAHGFAVLGEHQATVVYWVDARFNPTAEKGVAWNDPTLSIPWPTRSPILSERDKKLPTLLESE